MKVTPQRSIVSIGVILGIVLIIFAGITIYRLLAFSGLKNKKGITLSLPRVKPEPITESTIHELHQYFDHQYRNGIFNGCVLVGRDSIIYFNEAFGWAQYKQQRPLSTRTSFQLASVSKQFTAVAILMLKERGMLSLDDTVGKFIPAFPYHGISIRNLLGHRSGLPNYIYFCDKIIRDKQAFIHNSTVIRLMNSLKPEAYGTPDNRFEYNNTNYMLLAHIVSLVSGRPYESFLNINIFNPLEMSDSYVFNEFRNDSGRAVGHAWNWREVPYTFLDGVVGDKGIFSSTEDLFRWDQALYDNRLLADVSLDEAFMPLGKKKCSRTNYGYGWRMQHMDDSTKVLYHAGWWEGFQTLLVRIMKDRTTIVVLKNRKNTHIDMKAILSIIYPHGVQSVRDSTESIAEEEAGGPSG